MPGIFTNDAESPPVRTDSLIPDRAAAEWYLGRVCFKTGPPRRIGIELEWTVHHRDDPTRPLDPVVLATALGDYAPRTLRPGSPHVTLPHGGTVTVEPGGQVEISTPPEDSLAALHAATAADIAFLAKRLAGAGLYLGEQGCDAHRPGRRILHTERYAAMERAFDRLGPHGRAMMCTTAGLQVCLDAGTPDRVAARWAALHALGPVLLAVFANSPRRAGRSTGWVSTRMRTWFGTDPVRTRPPRPQPDPVAGWVRRVLDTPLLFVPGGAAGWDASVGTTFADWIAGTGTTPRRPPTYADLDHHLSTLFPPVRARGYFEVRYLDTQPGGGWLAPVAVLAALFARKETVDAAAACAAPAADRWVPAARDGLADPVIAAVAPRVLALARDALPDTDLPAAAVDEVADRLHDRLREKGVSWPRPMSAR